MPKELNISAAEVVRLYEQGHSVTEIAQELNISRCAVTCRIKAAGLTVCRTKHNRTNIVRPNIAPPRYTAADKERICRPPESCFSCPFPDCVQTPVANKGLTRTSGEEKYLRIAREEGT